mmetsp:Transcript_44883/g.113104  ORF Transcript_44883/g.113104 Transcript_44883/m.113104 type:complete len:214 (+) Transcript_44883:443-1084(+)
MPALSQFSVCSRAARLVSRSMMSSSALRFLLPSASPFPGGANENPLKDAPTASFFTSSFSLGCGSPLFGGLAVSSSSSMNRAGRASGFTAATLADFVGFFASANAIAGAPSSRSSSNLAGASSGGGASGLSGTASVASSICFLTIWMDRSSSSRSIFSFFFNASWRASVSGSRSMNVMYHPFSVSSTMHLPSFPKYLTKLVSVDHFVAFMWTW